MRGFGFLLVGSISSLSVAASSAIIRHFFKRPSEPQPLQATDEEEDVIAREAAPRGSPVPAQDISEPTTPLLRMIQDENKTEFIYDSNMGAERYGEEFYNESFPPVNNSVDAETISEEMISERYEELFKEVHAMQDLPTSPTQEKGQQTEETNTFSSQSTPTKETDSNVHGSPAVTSSSSTEDASEPDEAVFKEAHPTQALAASLIQANGPQTESTNRLSYQLTPTKEEDSNVHGSPAASLPSSPEVRAHYDPTTPGIVEVSTPVLIRPVATRRITIDGFVAPLSITQALDDPVSDGRVSAAPISVPISWPQPEEEPSQTSTSEAPPSVFTVPTYGRQAPVPTLSAKPPPRVAKGIVHNSAVVGSSMLRTVTTGSAVPSNTPSALVQKETTIPVPASLPQHEEETFPIMKDETSKQLFTVPTSDGHAPMPTLTAVLPPQVIPGIVHTSVVQQTAILEPAETCSPDSSKSPSTSGGKESLERRSGFGVRRRSRSEEDRGNKRFRIIDRLLLRPLRTTGK